VIEDRFSKAPLLKFKITLLFEVVPSGYRTNGHAEDLPALNYSIRVFIKFFTLLRSF